MARGITSIESTANHAKEKGADRKGEGLVGTQDPTATFVMTRQP